MIFNEIFLYLEIKINIGIFSDRNMKPISLMESQERLNHNKNLMKIHRIISIIFLISMTSSLAFGHDGNQKLPAAEWDTLFAELQIIEARNEPDSIKASLINTLFKDYGVSVGDYQKFYSQLMKENPKKQYDFLKRIEKILIESLKDFRQRDDRPPPSKVRKKSENNP
jgi:hypothetical protein